MFGFRKRRAAATAAAMEGFNRGLRQLKVEKSLRANVDRTKELFKDVDIMKYKYIAKDGERAYALVYSDGMVSASAISDNVIKPLMLSPRPEKGAGMIETLLQEVVQVSECKVCDDFEHIVEAISYGDTALFADGCAQAAIISTKNFPLRAIAEPDSEKALSGPREGFTESIAQSLSMLRRRARTNDFKIRQMTFGTRTRTAVAVCYFGGVVKRPALEELMRRLERIDIDGVLDSNYLTELIREHRFSPFRTIGYTERPDVVIGRLLEGRIAIVVDGTPDVLTLPYLFVENFQSGEDYYLSFYYTSFSRTIRMLGFLMTIIVPGFYISVVAFQHEMLPSPLLISITAERASVPFPAAVEAFIMLLVFDILRETGVRMPTNIGQALSIVGALVIGQAAVEAKLVAAPMIIVVAITGITNLLVPKLNAPVIYLRALLLLLSSIFGYFGLAMGMAAIMIHLIGLTSFGLPMLELSGGIRWQQIKDLAVRAPWWTMRRRPDRLAEDSTRMRPPRKPK